MKKSIIISIIQLLIVFPSLAGTEAKKNLKAEWPFDGFTGKIDRQSAQRGYKIYKEVCAVCHSVRLLAFRNLEDIGFSAAEIKAISAGVEVKDGPNEDGEYFMRPGLPSDHLPSPFANEKAARAANNGAYPPDLSLIIKARPDGANYVYSLLKGYEETMPEGTKISEGMYYNPYFPNSQIAMAPPLSKDQVSFDDGTEASVSQMARDVVIFLQWVSEPEMEQRKKMGIKVIIYLTLMTAIFMIAKNIVWKKVK